MNLPNPETTDSLSRQSILEHIDALRGVLVNSAVWVAVASVAGYFVSDRALAWLAEPVTRMGYSLYFTKPGEAFGAKCLLAFVVGLILAFPAIAWNFWRFLAPALHPGEGRNILPWLGWSVALFAAGIFFALFVALGWTLEFLLGFSSPVLKPMLSVSEYLSFVTTFALSFGAGFNLPVVMVALSKAGLVAPALYGRYRRHAYVLIFVVGAVLTPPDVASQMMLSLPLVALYEAGIFVSRRLVRAAQVKNKASNAR